MPVLIVQTDDARFAARFRARALIGRKGVVGVKIDDREVSRIHAWIDRDADGNFYVADAASRNGTRVDGRPVVERAPLADGAEIAVGPATLTFRLDDAAAAGEVRADVTDAGTAPGVSDGGILFACPCGAPLWVPPRMAGRFGRCVHCAALVEIPKPAWVAPPAAPRREAKPAASGEPLVAAATYAPVFSAVKIEQATRPASPAEAMAMARISAALETCSVCHSEISGAEEKTACPECGLTFHADCWQENRGCSAYGCGQVNILDPDAPRAVRPATTDDEEAAAPADDAATAGGPADDAAAAKAAVPWEYVLLAASVFAAVAGAFTFGVPPLAVGVIAAVYATRHRGSAAGRVSVLSAVIALLAVAAGVYVSRVWWLGHA